ncbi:MAG TPA: mammalian cell entry protein [Mycobacterium sp.]|nr:mammalian cell entry protein [Mycobacterium sp.]
MEDQPADPGDLTTGAETAEATEAKGSRRRWFSLRRRTRTPEPVAASAAEEDAKPEESQPQPRTPVGKARRSTNAQEPVENAVDEEAAESAESEGSEPEATEAPETPEDEQILVPHRPAGKRLTIAAAAAAVLFVAAAAFAGATLQPYLADRAAVDTKLDVARTAANAITTLWTYTPDNMEQLPDRSARYLGGDFAHEYRKYIDAIVAPNKQAQVTNTTQVMGAAVETLTPSEATAIVYTNSVATSPVTKNIPSLRYLSYRLTLERRDADWLITRMSTVTSLDLTPQL